MQHRRHEQKTSSLRGWLTIAFVLLLIALPASFLLLTIVVDRSSSQHLQPRPTPLPSAGPAGRQPHS